MNYRLNKLRKKLNELEVDAFLITSGINRRYLSGFSGSAGMLLITAEEAVLFTDSRYIERAEQEADGFTIYKKDEEDKEIRGLMDFLALETERLKVKVMAFESNSVHYSFYSSLKEKFPSIELRPVAGAVEKIREIKSSDEIDCIRKAASIAEEAYIRTMEHMVPGVRECDIRAHMNYFIQTLGGFNESFEIIVASGPNGAMPHARTSEKVINEGELVVIDFGATYKEYCSDCTRTVLLGEPDERQSFIYDLVFKAHQAALDKIGPGVPCNELDKAARDVFEKEGFIDEFSHSTGHAVGLNVHERPSLSFKCEDKLEPGMVVTVEPALYFSGWGGVRIEDLVLITEQGFELLTHLPYGLSKKK